MHDEVSERSRILQLSTYMRSPLQTYVTFCLISGRRQSLLRSRRFPAEDLSGTTLCSLPKIPYSQALIHKPRGYLLITGSELNALVPINLRAVAAMVVFDTQSMVPRMPVSAGNK